LSKFARIRVNLQSELIIRWSESERMTECYVNKITLVGRIDYFETIPKLYV